MSELPTRRLFLLGDADVLDSLAEIASRLRYDELHRDEDLPSLWREPVDTSDPKTKLGEHDHVVIAHRDPRRAREMLAAVIKAGDAGYVGLSGTEKDSLVALLKLSADRHPKAKLDRVSAPAGAATGGTTPDELAIGIAAELVAARHVRAAN